MTTPLLQIEDLCARVAGKEIIKNFNLTINEGEIHAIMGPNGAGKSTLSYVLSGKPGYEITSGNVWFKGKDLLKMSVEDGLKLVISCGIVTPENADDLKKPVLKQTKRISKTKK